MEPCKIALRNYLLSSVNRKTLWKSVISRTFVKSSCQKTSEKHRIYCYGLNEHGALGLYRGKQSKIKRFLAKPVKHYFAEENCVNNVGSGYGFTAFAVRTNDTCKVYGSGINTNFQIGNHVSQQNKPLDVLLKPAPINLGLRCPDTNVVKVSAGRAHLAVLTDKEGVFLSGSNCYGQCAREIVKDDKLLGVCLVNSIKKLGCEDISHVCCGQDHSIFVTKNGKVWSCGWGADGQTGLGHTCITHTPTELAGDIKGEHIVKIAGKCDTVLALSCNGDVFGWGSNEYEQLCEGNDVQLITSPIHLKNLKCVGKIVDIAAGGSFCMALSECGDVYVWGFGILGGGPELQKCGKPFKIPRTLFGWSNLQPDVKVTSITCGMSHLGAINNYKHLYMWGRNRHGCLGIGHVKDQYFPYKVALPSDAVKASCGVDHTMVLCKTC